MNLNFFPAALNKKKNSPLHSSVHQQDAHIKYHQSSRNGHPPSDLWTSTTCEEGEVQVAPRSMVLGSCFWRKIHEKEKLLVRGCEEISCNIMGEKDCNVTELGEQGSIYILWLTSLCLV